MLYRKAYEKLLQWKAQKNKKALCIFGARQIGKTTLIRQFGKDHYEHFVELNFVLDEKAAEIFSGSLDANTIITNLTAYTRVPMIPGKTLVLFDEVQRCPNVRTAIKFLIEDGRFDYIESGSLLGVRHIDVRSYPVGFEEIYRMYPMDFEEFALANGVQSSTIDYLRNAYEMNMPVTDSVHETMKKLFLVYIVVGGMPQVVQTYVDTHDIGTVIQNQNDILEQYRLDIAQYAETNSKPKIKAIFDAIPSQLNNKNRRFVLTNIDEHGRQNRYANSFNWLADAGVALTCYNVTEPKAPLALNEKRSLFKLFMGDTGLLCASCMENIQFDILQGNVNVNLGSILENIMAQQLKSNGFALHFFDTKKYGELDFVIQNGTKIDLVEIKSGNDYYQHSALERVMAVDEWKTNQSIVFCKGNVEEKNNIIYLPWYMVMFFKPHQIPTGTSFIVDISQL